MKTEEKQLLLKDLCARLPYGVKMRYRNDSGYEVLCQIDTFYKDVDGFPCLLATTGPCGAFQDLNELKPYLRPMSSMTEEEILQFFPVRGRNLNSFELRSLIENDITIASYLPSYSTHIDWLNKHHFDYRKLIEKGLALEAPEDMYKEK